MLYESEAYDVLASVYDRWQEESDPGTWASYTDDLIKQYSGINEGQGRDGRLLLADLGCGTGKTSALMAERGYDVLGIDSSPEMLRKAKESYPDIGIEFICQDISSMELFGTVDVMISLMDTVNHITDIRKLKSFFRMCKRYLNPGGILVFDIASLKHFAVTLGENTFTDDEKDFTLIWHNSFDPHKAVNLAEITIFLRNDQNTYDRHEAIIRERYYKPGKIVDFLEENGLEIVKIFADLKRRSPDNTSERIFFVVSNLNDPEKNRLAEMSG